MYKFKDKRMKVLDRINLKYFGRCKQLLTMFKYVNKNGYK